MTIKTIDPILIDPNPYQPASRLTFAEEELSDLASIREIGLLQIPQARPLPSPHQGEGPGVRYQLLFGHRRLAAWRLYRPGEPMPLDVVDADDQAMYERMAIENGQRLDLSPIEKAQLIKGHIERFGSTQAAAGALVGIKTQGGVSNLLRLLELPAEVQALVSAGALPERMARALLVFKSLDVGKDLLTIAQSTAAVDESDKSKAFDGAVDQLIRQHARFIHNMPWKKDWKPGTSADILGETIPLPACASCPFVKKWNYNEICLRPACWTAKMIEHAKTETAKAAQAKNVSVAAEGEKIKIIADPQQAKMLLASKSPAVRLFPLAKAPDDYMTRERLKGTTGTEYAEVAVLAKEAAALLKTLPKAKAKSAPTDWAARQREADAKRKAFETARQQVVETLTPVIVRRLPNDKQVLELMFTAVADHHWVPRDQKAERAIYDQWHDEKRISAKAGDLKIFLAHAILNEIKQCINSQTPAALQSAFSDFGAALKITWPPGWDVHLIPPPAPSPVAAQRKRGKAGMGAKQ